MKNKFYLLVLCLIGTACSVKKNADQEIKFLASPSTSNSAEPFLFTDIDSTVYLSWIEKNEGKAGLLRSIQPYCYFI